jgi:hypothetical protein
MPINGSLFQTASKGLVRALGGGDLMQSLPDNRLVHQATTVRRSKLPAKSGFKALVRRNCLAVSVTGRYTRRLTGSDCTGLSQTPRALRLARNFKRSR